jgi:lipopolysaccharide/colanic/teichoic acid biosynthesis glycosyltransferase
MPEKLALDLEYIANQSLFLDLKLIVQTFLCLFESDERTDRQYTGEGV